MYTAQRMIEWKLQDTLNRLGVSQYQLQKQSGVAKNTIREMCNGTTERPDLSVLNRVIDTLNVLARQKGQDLVHLQEILVYTEGK